MKNVRCCVVLAGGKSRRMGLNKALVKVKGREMLLWIVDQLKPLCDEMVVVARNDNDNFMYRKFLPNDVTTLMDFSLLEGPLVGIYSAFKCIRSECAYVHPVDSPIINKNMVEYLFKKVEGYDASIPQWDDGRLEPLHAVYRTERVVSVARNLLSRNNTSAKDLATVVHTNYVPITQLKNLDPDLLSFINLNMPGDLQTIEVNLGRSVK